MYREEDSKDKYEIYSYTDKKYRKSKWKKSSRGPEWRIAHQEYHEEDIYTHTDDSPECCLEYTMQCDEIIEENNSHENNPHKKNVKLSYLKCHRERREERHIERLDKQIVQNGERKSRRFSPIQYLISPKILFCIFL